MNKLSVISGKNGQISISGEVLAIIAGTAALEVEGVVAAFSPGGQTHMSARVARRNFAKGVKVSFDEGGIAKIDISIMVKFGFKIYKVSEEVQKRAIAALETMTGIDIKEVNVHVVGLRFPKQVKVRRA